MVRGDKSIKLATILIGLVDSMFSLSTFEHQLVMYVTADDKATFATAFDMSTIPVVSHEQALAEERTKKLTSATPTLKAPSTGPKKAQINGAADSAAAVLANAQKQSQQLMQIPELKAHGALLRSSSPVELTESETEYVVSVIKHIYKEHLVLQYDIKNTMPDTVLEEVSVVATPSEEEESLEEDFTIPVTKLAGEQPGTVFVSFKKSGDVAYPITSFTNVLKFTSKEIDPTTGEPDESGYEDEYQVEDLELLGSDYVTPAFAGSFDHAWEQTGANGEEASETLQLSSTKSIAGEHCSPNICQELQTDTLLCRCHRTAHKSALSPATRWHGRHTLDQHAHPQVVWQDPRWRQSRSSGEDGLFGEERRDNEDNGKERGRGRCCFAGRKRGVGFDFFLIYILAGTLQCIDVGSRSPKTHDL